MKKYALFLFTNLFCITLLAQQVPIGGWQEHLSYKNAISVAEGNGMVYCATTSGFFTYKKADNSTTRLSKVNGLSDVEAILVNFDPANGKVLVAFKNSNLDLIEGGAIINIPDIKNKPIIGNKSINNITFVGSVAYLSCGFGIVVIDMDRDEVKDTYYIGAAGAAVNVRDVTSDGTYLYAASDAGIFRALLSNPNLANYASWSLMTGLPTGAYNTITSFAGKIYTNYSRYNMSGATGVDSMFVYDGISWSHYIPAGFSTSGYTVYSLKNNNSQLVLLIDGAAFTFDTALTGTGYYSGYFGDPTRAKAVVLDNANGMWFADSKYGLVSYRPTDGYTYRYPNGPSTEKVLNMSVSDGTLLVAPGGYNTFFHDGIYRYQDNEWADLTGGGLDSIYDVMNVLVDPKNKKRAYAACWGQGVVELYNGVPVKVYNTTNSSLSGLGLSGYNPVWTYGLAMDEGNNLWVTNSGVTNGLSYKTAAGTWGSVNTNGLISTYNTEQITIDKYDQKWITVSNGGGGLLVYKGQTTSAMVAGVNAKKLTTSAGNGGLPSNVVYCTVEDKDNEIWVGTDKGVAVFFSPENVFSGQPFDAQQILLEQDGHVQILLETEDVLCIAVDDANRKWIGTSKSGVFLMSPDGTKQIQHFDESNSPLLSNSVKSIAINRLTGEVYFGTSKGVISYRGTSIEGNDEFDHPYAFPNPVKHGYEGPVAIKGLVDNTIVKITDISGTLVYETKSEGGQAIWDAKNFKDERVSTGVYIVFLASEDGSQKAVTKILVIN
ncbi:MAG: two-component regulator propeller domain-containing protein [Bacteroidia bacterium]